ncbi:MAG: oxidoreductase, partial [Bacteroidales bacterium]
KGEMEDAVLDASIPQISVMRPSMLLGPREEFRFGEEAGKMLMKVVQPFLRGKWKKYRGIRASTVAAAMQKIAEGQCELQEIFESDELQVIAEKGCNS